MRQCSQAGSAGTNGHARRYRAGRDAGGPSWHACSPWLPPIWPYPPWAWGPYPRKKKHPGENFCFWVWDLDKKLFI